MHQVGNKDSIEIYNDNGYKATFLNLGARWSEMHVPDNQGIYKDVVLGFSRKEDYLRAEERYHGAVVGRYCGRIPNGLFVEGNTRIELPLNEGGKNHLHGGENGFHIKHWETIPEYTTEKSVGFYLFSRDGEENYPGDLEIRVRYTLTEGNQIIFEVKARCTKKTVLNITNHTFFNLTGGISDISGHSININGDELVQDSTFLLTGTLKRYDRPYTFRLDGEISSAFLLKQLEKTPNLTLFDPVSGRYLKLYTDQPSIQLYNGFFMNGSDVGKNGVGYFPNSGLALEPQYLVPSPSLRVLSPGEIYLHRTVYEFGAVGPTAKNQIN